MYSKKVMEHFRNPHNMGEIENADATGEVGNPSCGDVMKVYLKIKKKIINGEEKEVIEDIKYQTMGCIAAISTSSMTTDLVIGKTIDEAEKITNKAVAEALESLPPIKMHCSNLAADALHKAIREYKEMKNKNEK